MPPKKSLDGPLKKGVKVKAKWSGSNSFYDGKILDVFPKTCKVEFEDGTVFNVKRADIKSPKFEEKDVSPKRTRSRSRSVGRPRSRSRSPARNEKKETVTKRGRIPKDEKKKSEENSKTTNSVKKDETDSIVKSSLTREKIGSTLMKEEAKASVSSVTTTNSVTKSLYISLEKKEPSEVRLRSTRMAALRSADISPIETKKTVYETRNAVSQKDEGKYSDDEESEEEEIKVVPKGPSKLMQTFHFIFTLLKIILMPTTLLFLAFACTKKQCTVLEVPQFYSRWKDVGNALKIPLPSVVLFHLSVCLMSLIPLGKKVTGFPFGPQKTKKEYRINGIFSLLISVLVFAICSYFGVYMNWGYDKFKALTLSTLLYCTLCSLIMQVVSLVKGDAVKESKIPLIGNFFNGVYCNPFLFGKVDVKTSFVRVGLIGAVLLNLSVILKFFLMKGYVSIPLACTAGMQTFFVFDYFIREDKMLSTATYTSDCVGYGFMMTTGFLVPVGLALQTVYLFIFETKAHLTPHYCYAAMVALFFLGYYIYMTSGNLKHNFRSNPFSPSLSDVDSIPTSQKKRLISSRLWGVIRHPNYLGLILMAFAWTLPCGFSNFSPFGPVVILILALIVRIFRVEAECKEKYGPAWNNYTEKVRSRLIPYIF